MISSHYTWCDHATKCQGSVWLKMKALIKLEAPELDEASSSSQSCTGILFTIQDPTAQVCRLKFQTLVGFRWVSEWASKANLLKFSWLWVPRLGSSRTGLRPVASFWVLGLLQVRGWLNSRPSLNLQGLTKLEGASSLPPGSILLASVIGLWIFVIPSDFYVKKETGCNMPWFRVRADI